MWQERAGKWICFGLGAFGAWLLLRYAFGAVLPFLLGGLVACLLAPLSGKLADATRLPKRLCAFFTVCLALFLFSMLLSVLLTRFLREAQTFLAGFDREGMAEELLERMPEGLRGYLSEQQIQALWEKGGSALTSLLTGAVAKILGGAPNALLGVIVALLSVFYLTVDGEAILESLGKLMPKQAGASAQVWSKRVKAVAGKYVRSLCLLFLLTLFEVFVGLVLLRRRYALLCALLVALVDLLPVLGSGAVLLPWALFCFLGGEGSVGIGLLVLWGVVTVIRQIVEPKLVGDCLGLHPFFSLFCMVLGMRLLGLAGMILFPLIASFLRSALLREATSSSA